MFVLLQILNCFMRTFYSIGFFLLFLFSLSLDTIVHVSKLINQEEFALYVEINENEKKAEDIENEKNECDTEFYCFHPSMIVNHCFFQTELLSFDFRQDVLFLSHDFIQEVYSPPEFL